VFLFDFQTVAFLLLKNARCIAAIEPSGKKSSASPCTQPCTQMCIEIFTANWGYCFIDAAPFLIVQGKRLALVFLNNHLLSFLMSLLQLIHNL